VIINIHITRNSNNNYSYNLAYIKKIFIIFCFYNSKLLVLHMKHLSFDENAKIEHILHDSRHQRIKFTIEIHNSVYFSVKFGAAWHCNTNLRLKNFVLCGEEFWALNCVMQYFDVPNLMIIRFCISESLKTPFKTGFSIRNSHLNLFVRAGSYKWI